MLLLAVLRATQMYLRNKTERRIFQQGFTIKTVLGSEGIRLRIVWVMLSWVLLNAAGWGGEEFEDKRVRFSARNVYVPGKSGHSALVSALLATIQWGNRSRYWVT